MPGSAPEALAQLIVCAQPRQGTGKLFDIACIRQEALSVVRAIRWLPARRRRQIKAALDTFEAAVAQSHGE